MISQTTDPDIAVIIVNYGEVWHVSEACVGHAEGVSVWRKIMDGSK
ncbi:MAG: hypothetical protein AAF636_13215 [Pseudomonadota bacterium]